MAAPNQQPVGLQLHVEKRQVRQEAILTMLSKRRRNPHVHPWPRRPQWLPVAPPPNWLLGWQTKLT